MIFNCCSTNGGGGGGGGRVNTKDDWLEVCPGLQQTKIMHLGPVYMEVGDPR